MRSHFLMNGAFTPTTLPVRSIASMAILTHLGSVLCFIFALTPSALAASRAELLAVAIAAPALFISGKRGAARHVALVLGLATPLLPCVTPNLLLPILCLFALSLSSSPQLWRTLVWASPLLAYLVGSLCFEIASSAQGLLSVPIASPERLHDIATSLVQTQAPSWGYTSRVLVFALLVGAFSQHGTARNGYLRGVWYGALVAAGFVILQVLGLAPFTPAGQTPFWTAIHRLAGTMSDPNALGVSFGLILWIVAILVKQKRVTPQAALVGTPLLLASGFLSGSRSFALGLGIFLVCLSWSRFRSLRYWILGAAASVVALISCLDSQTSVIQNLASSPGVPEGLRRTVTSLSLPRIEESLYSRSVFLSLSLAMIKSSPLFGVGPDRYRGQVVPMAEQVGLALNGWTDNSNNFYLGIIAELGIVGSLAFLLTVFGRRFKSNTEAPFGKIAIASLAVLLLTGPHTDFPEVLALVAALVSYATSSRASISQTRIRTIALLLGVGCLAPSWRERGVFDWQHTNLGVHRWLSNHAHIIGRCADSSSSRYATFTVRPEYVPTKEPLRVTFTTSGSLEELSFDAQETKTIQVPCPAHLATIHAVVDTHPAWSPYRAWPGRSTDRRLLGVQQLKP